MTDIRETILVILTVACLVIGGWNLAIAILGRIPRFCGSAVGTLTKAKTRQNVRSRSRAFRRTHPIVTNYTYTYSVNGRQYKHSWQNFLSKRKLPQTVSMIYVKFLPHRAYPNLFTGELEWILGVILVYMGIMLLHGFSKATAHIMQRKELQRHERNHPSQYPRSVQPA